MPGCDGATITIAVDKGRDFHLMEACLHIGTEKTGTTTIQQYLAGNRADFLKAGMLVPQSLGEPNHRLLAGIASDADYVDDLFRQQGLLQEDVRDQAKKRWWIAFAQEVTRSGAKRVIISSEHLQSRLRSDSELARLKQLLGELFSTIRICLYIREPMTTAVSLFSTAVKCGASGGDLPGPENPYFNNVVHHARTLRRWSAVFGADAITVRLFSKDDFVNGDLIDDFTAACDLPIINVPKPKRENEALSALGIELLRRINKRIPVFGADGVENPQRGVMTRFFEQHFSQGPRYAPKPGVIKAYEAAFAESNEWVRKTFFPDRNQLFSPYRAPQPADGRLGEGELQQIADALSELWLSRPDPGNRAEK